MSVLTKIWKKIGGKDWVNDTVEKLIQKARVPILSVMKKYLNDETANKATEELIAELLDLKEKIW